jgi:hypothetical protein
VEIPLIDALRCESRFLEEVINDLGSFDLLCVLADYHADVFAKTRRVIIPDCFRIAESFKNGVTGKNLILNTDLLTVCNDECF